MYNWIMDEILVGRGAELARIEQFLDQALAGHGQVIFVAGEAGAGKTALVREFVRHAQAENGDLLVALGEADAQTGVGDPYLPFREVLRLLTGDVGAQLAEGAISSENVSRLREFVGVSARVLLDLGPDLIEFFVPGVALATRVGTFFAGRAGWLDRLERQVEAAQAVSVNGSGDVEQERIFEQYTNVLEALASHRPIVLILDDLQWADAASISLLFRLGRRIGDSRVLVIGTYRPNDVALGRPTGPGRESERHPLLPVVNELKRYGGDIEIQLDRGSGATGRDVEERKKRAYEFVSAYIDAAYSPHNLDEHTIGLIAERTGGHPLFTIELLRSLEERGWLTCQPPGAPSASVTSPHRADVEGVWTCPLTFGLDALPPRMEAVVAERIDRLTDEQRRVLTVASVEGDEFTAQVIAHVEGLSDLALVQIIEEDLQKRHQLVQELGIKRHDGKVLFLYQFRHRPFQRYLYDQLGMAQRLLLHNAVGEALESIYGDDIHNLEVTLAHHFLAAGNDTKALKYLVAAGDHAWGHHATHEALAHYTKALEVAGRLGSAVAPKTIEDLHIRRAQVQGWLGHVDEAVSDYEQALEMARERDDTVCQVQCLNQMGALLAGPRGFDEGVTHAQQALEIARKAGDKRGIIDSLNCLGNFQANLGNLTEAAASHEEALALARVLGDERRVADSLDGLRLVRHDGQTGDTALLEEVIEIRRRLGDKKGLLDPLAALGNALGRFEGQLDRAEQLLSEALEISQRIGERTTRPWVLATLAEVFWRRGRLGEAYARANEALDLAREIEHAEWTAISHMTLSMVNLALYRYAEAEQHVAKGDELGAKSRGFWVKLIGGFQRGIVALQAGDAAGAIAFFEPVMAQVQAANLTLFALLGAPWLAMAYAAEGQVDRARELIDSYLADPALETMLELYSMARHAEGCILTAAGDLVGAEAALKDALEVSRQTGNVFFQIKILGMLGRLYRDASRAGDAQTHFGQLLQLGEEVADSIDDPDMRDAYLAAAPFAEARAALDSQRNTTSN
jgi:tetratricopeptide (TPR) repeat protein